MSLKSSNKVETNRYELEIEIAAEDFEKAVNKAFKLLDCLALDW